MNIWEKLTDTQGNTTDTIREFNKRYEGSILTWQRADLSLTFLYYSYYDQDSNRFIFSKEGVDDAVYLKYDYPFKDENLFVTKIKKGFYYSDLSRLPQPIVYFTHVPQRQWIRGITPHNIKLLDFTYYLINSEYKDYRFSKTIYNILRQQYTKYVIPIDVFSYCEKNNHVILNNDFLLTQNCKSLTGYSLFYHKYLVGTFVTPTTFKVENTLFLQEFLEAKETWPFTFSIEYQND